MDAPKLQLGLKGAKALAVVAMAVATLVVLLDVFGVIDAFDEGDAGRGATTRLPGEYLYLDDERVDAYLGQLRGGLAPSEKRSSSSTRVREASVGAEQVLQVGGSLQEQETVEQTVSLRATDRYYVLESELQSRFAKGSGATFRRVRSNPDGCRDIRSPTVIQEGQIVRITGAQLQAPTYVLALAKVAHAAQFRSPGQDNRRFRVSRQDLSDLAGTRQQSLKRYVRRFGRDPRLPFRLRIPSKEGSSSEPCDVFMPALYSKLTEAPSLLTGRVTVVGKVVRRLTAGDARYFDVETAAAYERAVQAADPLLRRTLGLSGSLGGEVVSASATTDYPGLVVLPLAMYK